MCLENFSSKESSHDHSDEVMGLFMRFLLWEAVIGMFEDTRDLVYCPMY